MTIEISTYDDLEQLAIAAHAENIVLDRDSVMEYLNSIVDIPNLGDFYWHDTIVDAATTRSWFTDSRYSKNGATGNDVDAYDALITFMLTRDPTIFDSYLERKKDTRLKIYRHRYNSQTDDAVGAFKHSPWSFIIGRKLAEVCYCYVEKPTLLLLAVLNLHRNVVIVHEHCQKHKMGKCKIHSPIKCTNTTVLYEYMIPLLFSDTMSDDKKQLAATLANSILKEQQ